MTKKAKIKKLVEWMEFRIEKRPIHCNGPVHPPTEMDCYITKDGEYVAAVGHWQPDTNFLHAWMLVEKYKEIYSYEGHGGRVGTINVNYLRLFKQLYAYSATEAAEAISNTILEVEKLDD